MPVCRQVESRGGALRGSGSLSENSANESPCHPTPIPACPAGAEEWGNATAMEDEDANKIVESSPEWKSLISSTPRVIIDRIDLTVSPRGGVQAPPVTAVEAIDSEEDRALFERLRKRGRRIDKTGGDITASDNSFETREARRCMGKKKKSEEERKFEDRRKVEELREELRKAKEKLAEYEETVDPPDYSLLQRRRTLPSVEDIMDEMSLEPYFALEGVIS